MWPEDGLHESILVYALKYMLPVAPSPTVAKRNPCKMSSSSKSMRLKPAMVLEHRQRHNPGPRHINKRTSHSSPLVFALTQPYGTFQLYDTRVCVRFTFSRTQSDVLAATCQTCAYTVHPLQASAIARLLIQLRMSMSEVSEYRLFKHQNARANQSTTARRPQLVGTRLPHLLPLLCLVKHPTARRQRP